MNAPHPSTILNAAHIAVFRDNATAAEELGMLNEPQLALVDDLSWFKLLVPQVYGGLEKSLPELVRLQEAISWTDGSAGWTVTLCCGAGWFGGFIQPEIAREIFYTPNLCLAGSGAVSGEAEVVEGGYCLSGTWKYASGAHHATHFTANCNIKKDGEFVKDAEGKPLVLPFIIDKKDVTLLPAWKYVGMIATGSHSFNINDVVVANERSFRIDPAYAKVEGKLYQYPFLQLAEATLAVNLSGMAVHFIDLCKNIFEERLDQPRISIAQKQLVNQLYQDTIVVMELARAGLFSAVDASWAAPLDNNKAELKEVSKASRVLAIASREAVDKLYPYCGLIAAASDSEINRVWRDIHTAGQHSLLTFAD